MAQLWLTYDENAEPFGCRPDAAEHAVRSHGWTRKRSQDSQIRALLPQGVMQAYVLKVAAALQAQAGDSRHAVPAPVCEPPAPVFRRAA